MAKSSLNDMSIAALQSEIKRREKHANSLQKRREKLVKQLAEIDAEIAELGGVPGRGKGGRRPRNESNLPDALADVLYQKEMSVTEAADAVRANGYITTSPNFRTIVNQALIRDARFKRVGRGLYTATSKNASKSSAKSTRKKTTKKKSRKTTKKS